MKRKLTFLKKRIRRDEAPEILQNEYYENVSAHFGIAQVILYISLLAFIFVSFLTNTELITYRNFYYFFKDLNASAETVDVLSVESVSYPTSPSQSFTLYRQGLAVAGNNDVTVFTATGRQTVSRSVQYQNPTAIGSGKYLLVYEAGGHRYSLYNSYTQIHAGVSDYPIVSATVSDSGMYAITSFAEEYSSVVSLYSSHFSLLNRYNKNGYVMDVSIQEKGNLVAILTAYAQNGSYLTRLEAYEPGKTQEEFVSDLPNTLGLSCSFTDTGRIAVLSGDGAYFFEPSGELRSSYDFAGRRLAGAVVDRSGIAVFLQDSPVLTEGVLVVTDQNGDVQLETHMQTAIKSMARSKHSLYFVSGDSVVRLNVRNGEQSTVQRNTENRTLLAVSEKEALLCSPQKAEYLHFD